SLRKGHDQKANCSPSRGDVRESAIEAPVRNRSTVRRPLLATSHADASQCGLTSTVTDNPRLLSPCSGGRHFLLAERITELWTWPNSFARLARLGLGQATLIRDARQYERC